MVRGKKMIKEQVTSNGNCYIYKYYKLDDIYYVDIYREHGITGERIFQTTSRDDSLKSLIRIIGQWENYYQNM